MRADIRKAKKRATPEYGGNVMPAMEIFRSLRTPQEKNGYRDALELLLRHDDPKLREFGIFLTLGFFVFRDVI